MSQFPTVNITKVAGHDAGLFFGGYPKATTGHASHMNHSAIGAPELTNIAFGLRASVATDKPKVDEDGRDDKHPERLEPDKEVFEVPIKW